MPDFSRAGFLSRYCVRARIFCFESWFEYAIFLTVMAGTGTVRALLARKDSPVWSISPNATVFDAIQLMADKNVGALPVIDNSRLVGIISERDYARKVILKGRFSKDTPVGDIMTQELLTATPSDTITRCIRVMTEKRVRHLPVLEGTEMIGIVSIGDVLKWFFRPERGNREPRKMSD
jgi:CBS domain-containing protein